MGAVAWVTDSLDRSGIAYQQNHHRRAFTAQELAEIEHVSGHRVIKVVLAIVDGRPFELVLPASRKVALEKIANYLGAHDVRLASEEEMQGILGDCEVGAAPPLRHWKDVNLVMDESLRRPGKILFQGGTHMDAVRMEFDDWFRLVKPEVANFAVMA